MPDRYAKSRALFEQAQSLVAGGISSQIRRSEQPVPLFFARAKHGRMWDVDGNEYVDYVQGMGPNLFGHSPDFLIDAVARAMQDGIVFTGQFERELEVAEMVREAVPAQGDRPVCQLGDRDRPTCDSIGTWFHRTAEVSEVRGPLPRLGRLG